MLNNTETTMTSERYLAMDESERYAWETAHRASLTPGSVVQVRRETMSGRAIPNAGFMLTVVENDGGATVLLVDADGMQASIEARNLALCVSEPAPTTT